MGPLSRTRVERRSRWPAGAGAARVHRRSKTSTRPLFVRSSRAPSRPRAPVRLLQMHVSASTTTDHSNIPNHRKVIGTTAGSTESCLSIEASRRRYAGSGAETPSLDTPHRDCSRWRLRPDPDRFGHLLSRAPPASLSGATREESSAAICCARLQGMRGARIVRRPISAKKPSVHRTEGPSVVGPFAERTGRVFPA